MVLNTEVEQWIPKTKKSFVFENAHVYHWDAVTTQHERSVPACLVLTRVCLLGVGSLDMELGGGGLRGLSVPSQYPP